MHGSSGAIYRKCKVRTPSHPFIKTAWHLLMNRASIHGKAGAGVAMSPEHLPSEVFSAVPAVGLHVLENM